MSTTGCLSPSRISTPSRPHSLLPINLETIIIISSLGIYIAQASRMAGKAVRIARNPATARRIGMKNVAVVT